MNEKSMKAALDLHRPIHLDKYGRPTDDKGSAKWIRCEECRESVTDAGCRTWQVANA
jgi:ribosomal protein S26